MVCGTILTFFRIQFTIEVFYNILKRRSLAPSQLGQVKRKFDDEDNDPSWSEKNKRGSKNKKPTVVDRSTEFLSPFRKPLTQCSLSALEPNSPTTESGSTFHVNI